MSLVKSIWMLAMPEGTEGLAGRMWHAAGADFLAPTNVSV